MIYLAQDNDETVIDQIPLAEIQSVKEMVNIEDEAMESTQTNGFIVETHPEGYNSGRTYYLRANSKAECQDIVQKLSQHSAAARETAHARSVFAKAQRKVDKVYRSTIFQSVIAFLIVAVRLSYFFYLLNFASLMHLTTSLLNPFCWHLMTVTVLIEPTAELHILRA